MVAKFSGLKYKLVLASSSRNYEEYMEAIGVDMIPRKWGKTIPGTVELTVDGDDYTFTQTSTLFRPTLALVFKLGQEYPYTTMEGRRVTSTFNVKGDTLEEFQLVEIQDGVKVSTITREFQKDKMIATSSVDNVKSVRFYNVVKTHVEKGEGNRFDGDKVHADESTV